FETTNFFRRFGRACERKERQSSGRSEAGNLGAVRIRLKRDVKRGAGVIHRVTDERLHRDIPASGIASPRVETFVSEMAARSRELVGDDAEERTAESEQRLPSLSVGIALG